LSDTATKANAASAATSRGSGYRLTPLARPKKAKQERLLLADAAIFERGAKGKYPRKNNVNQFNNNQFFSSNLSRVVESAP
jgi:hypothetical protein